jgi:alanine racemase
MNTKQPLKVRTWLEIDQSAMARNYNVFRSVTKPETKLMAVVKSNAYGNELIGFSKIADKFGADSFGVDSITEGIALREAGITKPILVLGFTIPENVAIASEKGISITLSSFDALHYLIKNKTPIKVHVKIDTGMHRQGFSTEDAEKLANLLLQWKHITVEGVYTHFANAKNPRFSKDTDKQAKQFEKTVAVFKKSGFSFLKHASATSGTILFPKYHYDMVRIGIGLHGLWPSREVKKASESYVKLSPILSWKTVISEIKTVKKGEGIGYDFSEILKRNAQTAICPIGYWHGYPRALSSSGYVLIHGKRARVLGRVAMDMIVIDITGIKDVRMGDEVILIGKQGNPASAQGSGEAMEEVTADELAKLCKTTNYEIVTRINPKIQRLFV